MDDHVVYRDTGAGGKPTVTKEAGGCPLALDILADDLVDLPGGNPGFHRLTCKPKGLLRDFPRFSHQAERNRHRLYNAFPLQYDVLLHPQQ